MAFLFSLLDRFPEAKRKVIQEVDEVLGNSTPSFDSLGRMKYLSAVVKETLRFFPIGTGHHHR